MFDCTNENKSKVSVWSFVAYLFNFRGVQKLCKDNNKAELGKNPPTWYSTRVQKTQVKCWMVNLMHCQQQYHVTIFKAAIVTHLLDVPPLKVAPDSRRMVGERLSWKYKRKTSVKSVWRRDMIRETQISLYFAKYYPYSKIFHFTWAYCDTAKSLYSRYSRENKKCSLKRADCCSSAGSLAAGKKILEKR